MGPCRHPWTRKKVRLAGILRSMCICFLAGGEGHKTQTTGGAHDQRPHFSAVLPGSECETQVAQSRFLPQPFRFVLSRPTLSSIFFCVFRFRLLSQQAENLAL